MPGSVARVGGHDDRFRSTGAIAEDERSVPGIELLGMNQIAGGVVAKDHFAEFPGPERPVVTAERLDRGPGGRPDALQFHVLSGSEQNRQGRDDRDGKRGVNGEQIP